MNQRRHTLKHIALLLGLLSGGWLQAAAPENPPLNLGDVITGEMRGGESRVFHLDFPAERVWRLRLDEDSLDLVLAIERLEGEADGGVGLDSPVQDLGTERYLFLQAEPGPYRVTVRPRAGVSGTGGYRLRLDEMVIEDERDRLFFEAEIEMMRAAEFSYDGRRESLEVAVRHYEKAQKLWHQLGEPSAEAEAWQGLAELQRRLGDPRLGIESFGHALDLARQLDESRRQASILNSLGRCFWLLGEIDEARSHLEQALELWRRLEDPSGEAHSLNYFCLTHQQRGELEQALGCYQQAWQLFRDLGDRGSEARVLNNIGSIYSSQGEPRMANEYFERALDLYRHLGLEQPQVATLNNLAVLYRRTGEIQIALRQYDEILELQRDLGDRRGEARTLNNVGRAYLSLGEPGRAQSYFERALPLRRATGDRRGEAATLNNLGQVYSQQGRFDEALDLHEQALDLAESLQLNRSTVVALTELGRAYTATGNPDGAFLFFERALGILDGTGERLQRADVLISQGIAFTSADRAERADASLREALTESSLAGYREGEVKALYALADLEYRLNRLHPARELIETALQRIETLRTRLSSPALRAAYLAAERDAFELAIDISMALHELEPEEGHSRRALAISERGRARILLDMLQEAETDLARRAAPEWRERRQDLERRLNSKADQRLILGQRSSVGQREREELDSEIVSILTELETVEAEIRRQIPGYSALTTPPSLSAADYKEMLDPDTVLLEYALTREGGYLWWISDQRIDSFPLPATREEIENRARQIYQSLSVLDIRGTDRQERALEGLTAILLGPIADRLRDQRLVVVADGPLNYIPFAALPVKGVPLLVDHEVVHLPSASALTVQRRETLRRKPGGKKAVILADPVFDFQDPRISTPGPAQPIAVDDSNDDWPVLQRLPATRREAKAIADLATKGEVVTALDFDANRQMALDIELAEYQVVHFATHGILDAETPRLSGLALSRMDREGRPQEGFLRLHDIYRLELGAELAVLSGCQTALGKEIRGEGLIGLTRGFMHAGVPRVVASLWRVEEEATAALMVKFYRYMWRDQLTPASALRAAQLSLWKERRWRNPYFWAAFLLQGEWRGRR